MDMQKNWARLTGVILACLVLIAGCGQQAQVSKPSKVTEAKVTKAKVTEAKVTEKKVTEEKVTVKPEIVGLALKLQKGSTANYKVIMENERSAEFAGQITEDEQFKSGKTGSKTELVFSQSIEKIDDKGNATAKITMKAIKYQANFKGTPAIDFDSSKEEQKENPLSKLIGQSYVIVITPHGEVINVRGNEEIKGLVAGSTVDNSAAIQFISQDIIKKRHSISALADATNRNVKPADKWSGIKTVSFDIMGQNTFEKIYTYKEIEKKNGQEIAVVDLYGIPSAKGSESSSELTKMFDSSNKYTGILKLNLTSGMVEEYTEKMHSEWTIVDVKGSEGTTNPPSRITLGITELHSLERID